MPRPRVDEELLGVCGEILKENQDRGGMSRGRGGIIRVVRGIERQAGRC